MNHRYRLLDVKGEGSLGIVFRAFDMQRKHDVAIKCLKSQHPDERRQLEHEALLLEKLQHRFIVHLLDYEIEGTDPYLVFEYCDRGSLRHWIGRLHWGVVVWILVQVVQGLQRIHDFGGFHCDLKPENLLMKSTNDEPIIAKIADFGIAHLPGLGRAMTHGPKGTRGYIAREVLEGKPFSAAADIYSLGIVATELLTGKREPPRLTVSNAPSDLRSLVLAMTNPRLENRPTLRMIADVLDDVSPGRCVVPNSNQLEIN